MTKTTRRRIALTGTISSGKSMVAQILVEKGYKHVSLSDMIREVCKEKGIAETRESLIETGNWIREKGGPGALAEMVAKREGGDGESLLVVETVRNPAEAKVLEEKLGCELWAVDAPLELRYSRMVERNRSGDPMSFEEFERINKRDAGEGEGENGQQVGKCIEMAKVNILNDGDEVALRKKVEENLGD